MNVTAVRRFSLIALMVAVSPLSACSADPSPSERAQVQQVGATAQAHKDAIKQQKTARKLKDQASAKAARAARVRKAPQYGYQCMPGDEKRYNVCSGHKAWLDGQVVYDTCINAGRTWDAAAQECGAMDPDAGPEGDHDSP